MQITLQMVALAEIVSAIYFVILFFTTFRTGEKNSATIRRIRPLFFLTLIWVLSEALAIIFLNPGEGIGRAEYIVLYLLNLLSFSLSYLIQMFFYLYCDAYLQEKTSLDQWVFRIPALICAGLFLVSVVNILSGRVFGFENGSFVVTGGTPAYALLIPLLLLFYAPIVAFTKRKEIGLWPTILLASFGFPTLISLALLMTIGNDFSILAGAISVVLATALMQGDSSRNRIEKNAAVKALADNSSRLFALEDNFESLYEVDMESGSYISFVKGDFYRNIVTEKLVTPTDYFEDQRANIDAVIWPEDRDGLYRVLSRDSIRRVLSENEHFDYYYRLITEKDPVWFRMRVVYKDAEKKHIIIGAFNAEREIAVDQLKEQQAELQKAYDQINEVNRRNRLLHRAVKAGTWSYAINAEDEVIAANYDSFGGLGTAVNNAAAPMSWVDALHPDDKERALDEFMAAIRDHSGNTPYEATYRMMKPDGSYLWMKTSGRLDRHEDGTAELVGISVDITDEIEKEHKRLSETKELEDLIESFASTYNIAYAVNLADDSFRQIRMDEDIIGSGESFDNFTQAKNFFIDLLPESDKARMRHELDYDTIREKLADVKTYTVEYRVPLKGAETWHEMNVTRIGEDSIALGFAVRDLEITQKHLEEKRFSEYFALYEVDIDAAMLKVVKDSPWYEINRSGTALPYVPTILQFASGLDEEPRTFFEQLADLEYVKSTFANEDKRTYAYRSNNVGDKNWVDCTMYVTLRHGDGTPAMFTFGFSLIDSLGVFQQELQGKYKEALDIASEANLRNELLHGFVNAVKWSYEINADDQVTAAQYDDPAVNGYAPGSEWSPMSWVKLLHPEDQERVLALFMAAVRDRSGETPYDTSYRIRDREGNYHWHKVSGKVHLREDGTRELFGMSVDVTEEMEKEHEHQQELQEALAMAQSASRAKTTFLNSMSHDIRTPMNAIIGFTGLAASHIDNKEQVQEYLTKIGQSSSHLLSLINDVLDMSRIESGKMNLDERPENLPDMIHTLSDIVQAEIKARQHDFFIDTVNVNDENIICDKLRVNQVLLNILSNAIKYTAAGGTIAMRIIETTVKPNGYATYEFHIKDNGMGMDEEYLKTIFDPFTRMKTSTVSGIQGTGLGMAITKNIVDMMGGEISIKSQVGKGTEIVVTFDFMLADAPKESVVIPELQGLRALVADDDANTCVSVYGMLKEIGMRSEWCTTGKEAVFRAEAAFHEGDLFKVYIIDWLMPDMNGIETARRIRKVTGEDAAIIILTAYDWSDVEEEAREAGVTAFVSKPLFPSDLRRVLNRCLGKEEEEPDLTAYLSPFVGKKVLLVEDNELNREIATEILTAEGFVIDAAEDGDIAVEKIRAAQVGDYDLVLMDVQMPRMDGYEATRQIRALGTEISRIPIIAMTANAFEEDRKLAFEAGMDEHIAKPIDVDKLKGTLMKFI